MNARDEAVEMIRRICPPHLDANEYGQFLAEKFDAHRVEVLAEAKTEVVAWMVAKAAEDPWWNLAAIAAKVDRGAIRIFRGIGHYWDALTAHAAKTRREDAEFLLAESRAQADRAIFSAGIKHAAQLIAERADEGMAQ